jgi:xylulokinase
VDVFRERGLEPTRVRVTNGGARSRLWKQVVADVIGQPLEVPRASAGSALGAGFTAGMGTGLFSAWDEIGRFVDIAEVVEPDPNAHTRYGEVYPLYRELYPALRPILHATSRQAEEVRA